MMRRLRNRQSGSVMLVAMTTLTGLLAIATVTLVKVKRGINASSQSRFQSVALFAAESGVSAGMDHLRNNVDPTDYYKAFINPDNNPINPPPIDIPGNAVAHGDVGNLFVGTTPMSYEVTVLNNPDDPGFSTGDDTDGVVILRSIGRGPGNSMVVLEVEVDGGNDNTSRPCPGYAQKGMAEDGAGRNDCLGVINSATTTTFTPGS